MTASGRASQSFCERTIFLKEGCIVVRGETAAVARYCVQDAPIP